MALIRPVVLVFQEFATPTVATSNPDLNCLVVGPAYHIQDYFVPGSSTTFADKTSILLAAAYGELEADTGTATPVGPAVITVADAPNNVVGAIVDAASVVVYFDEATVAITSGTSGTTSASTPSQFDVADVVDFTTGVAKVLPGDKIILSDGVTNIVRTVYTVETATRLTFTADIPAAGWTPAGTHDWRIERTLNNQVIADSFFGVTGNAITIDGGVTLAVTGQGAKTVTYAKVYVAYRALRQDLGDLDVAETTTDITANIGRLDARNPLAVGVFVARQNTTSGVQYIGVLTDDLAGHTAARDSITTRDDVYAIVPLTADVPTLAMWNVDVTGLALPDETKGRPQRFRAVIGSGTLPVTADIIEAQVTGKTETLVGSAPATINQLTVPGATFIADGVIPGDELTIALDTGVPDLDGTYTVAQVISNTVLQIDGAFSAADATLDVLATFRVRSADGLTTRRAATVATSAAAAAVGPDLYLLLRDPNGTFMTSGVAAGDIIEMPQDFSTSYTGALSQFVVASVLSENRLLIANNDVNTSTTENELPHGVKRIGGSSVATTATLSYRIVRTLSKSQQVTSLVEVAQSFSSKRMVMVWPDVVNVAGVTGGSSQPGHYLSCAVGGMTAGLPPHQGFTFLGVAGISRIYHSNTYFSDPQLTDLSMGGWYVFAQQAPTSLPYTVHQLTTDVSTLESGEFSVVKNYDFVALFFIDILEVFLGRYNITPEMMLLVRSALDTGGETLRLRSYAKIGAPLTSFEIASLEVSSVSADRLVSYLNIGLPKPLNVFELHLVA